jgi:hypothetical protein
LLRTERLNYFQSSTPLPPTARRLGTGTLAAMGHRMAGLLGALDSGARLVAGTGADRTAMQLRSRRAARNRLI